MNGLTLFFEAVKHQTIEVPIWQLLLIFVVAAFCIVIRGSKMSLLITYIFTLNIAFGFFKDYFNTVTQIVVVIFSVIILIAGLYDVLTES